VGPQGAYVWEYGHVDVSLFGHAEGEKQMDAIESDRSEPNATSQKAQANPEKPGRPKDLVDTFADARRAKKKQKRARHRARLRRSHTNG